MHRYVWVVLGLSLFLFGAPQRGGAGDKKQATQEKEQKRIAGTWESTSAMVNGQKQEAFDGRAQLRVVLKGDTYTLEMDGNVVERGTQKVDPTKKPKFLDITGKDGPDKGKTVYAIYEVKGDEMRICVTQPGLPRPTEFSSTENSGRVLATYRRVRVKD